MRFSQKNCIFITKETNIIKYSYLHYREEYLSIINYVKLNNIFFLFFCLVRQPLNDYHSSHRANVRHLPSIPLPKVSAINGPAITSNPSTTNRFHANNLFLQSLTSTAGNSIQQQKRINFKPNKYGLESVYTKPRTIIIVKQGSEKPHKTINILLNRRTAQTFDQLLSDISEAFGFQKSRAEKVKFHWKFN